MLRRLLNRLAGRQERNIFRFWDGKRERYADPLALWCALADDPEFNLNTTPFEMDRGELPGMKIAIRAAHRVFGVKGFEEGGLTGQESLALLIGFLNYMATLKKSTSGTQTLPPPMASECLATSTTKPAADSSRTEGEPTTAGLT